MNGSPLIMSTSFGIQAAVMLHLATTVVPNIPVIWVDTGYLPGETYRFA
ncbi:MAG: phosphoadenosine phosphosulfate reductase family protein, partial [Okeania sp. SIO2G4]|nr:phosphoadenosine phosphosulfate reductase family protein [Okeania sp. SIO2G4]